MLLFHFGTGIELFLYAAIAIPLSVGCVAGLIAARQRRFDWRAILSAPIVAVIILFVGMVIADLAVGTHLPSNDTPILLQSVARTLLFAPFLGLIGVPIPAAACTVTQLLCLQAKRWKERF